MNSQTHLLKKGIAVFLIALMLLSVAPLAAMSDVLPKLDLDFDLGATAHAEGGTSYLMSGFCGDTSDGKDGTDIAWSLDADGTLTLTGTGKMGSTPNRADNRVKKLVVGEGITEIAAYAFAYCQNLQEVWLPLTNCSVGEYAFHSCIVLETVHNSDGLSSIGGYAFCNCKQLKQINLGNCISIGEFAFENCVNITNVFFSENLTAICSYSFAGCNMLTSIIIPSSVDTIDRAAFVNCVRLTTLVLNEGLESIKQDAFNSTAIVELVFPDSLKEIGTQAFYLCKSLSSVSFGNSLESIGTAAFCNCNNLTGVIELPDSCLTVQSVAFSNTKITKFLFGKNLCIYEPSELNYLEKIEISPENTAFSSYDGTMYTNDYSQIVQCTNKSTLNIPAEFKQQNNNFLSNWPSVSCCNVDENNDYYQSVDGIVYSKDGKTLIACPRAYNRDVIIKIGTETIGKSSFYSCKISGVEIPNTVSQVDESAFMYCSGVGDLILPPSITKIQARGFYSSGITSISFSEGLKDIGQNAFGQNNSLVTLDFPDSLMIIRDGAFSMHPNVTNLQSVRFGQGLLTIGKSAFSYASKLEGNIVFPDSCTSVGAGAFTSTSVSSFYIGSGMTSFGSSAYMYHLESIAVSEDNQTFSSYDGVLYSKDYSEIIQIPSVSTLNLPAEFKEQKGGFLDYWYMLDTVNVDEENEYYASFDGILYSKDGKTLICCPRARSNDVYIHEGTEIISGIRDSERITGAFYECSKITSVNIPDSVKYIEDNAFRKCGALNYVSFGEGVLTIGPDAFHGCRLNNVVLGNNTKTISTAFNNNSGLSNIVLSKKLQSWDLNNSTAFKSIETMVVPNRFTAFSNYGNLLPSSSESTITGYCGSSAHEMAIKRLFKWNSLGHTWLNWYVAEPATFEHDGLEKRDCAYCDESEERVIPKLEHETFTATFVADGRVVASVDFQKGITAIDEPAVPARDRYTGKWEDYTLNDEDLTINAVYTLIKSDDAQEIETESTVEHYTEKDNVLFRMKASSAAKIVKSYVSQSIPLDIVLVVDQSGSMNDTLGGTNKKVDALKDTANSFIASVAENARLTGANHRIGIVGFGLAGSYSDYQMNENTELLTGANGVVNYSDVTPADYASALLPVLNDDVTNAALTDAVAAIEARGATVADLGLEMAKGVFANTDSTGRDRVVVFMTDGEPTYTNGFQTQVANNAVYNSYLLKNAYDALVYSVGIFDQSQSSNNKIKNFMQAVSSNYPNAKTYTSLGAEASDVFSITASNTDALNDVFRTITTESLSHTAPFDNVTLIKTLSSYVTLTAPQEETLRVNVIRQYGVSNDQITITRDDQGRTQIRIDGLTPYEVTDDEGSVSYEVAIEFFASLNENAAAAGTYVVDTDDSGIMLGDNAVGYEATFSTNELTLSAQKTRYIFTINGEIYEIAEGSSVSAAVPETDFAADWQFSGWNTTGVSNAKGTIIDATLVKAPRTVTWHTADGDVQQIYTEGQFLTPPEVADRADGSKFLSWDKSLPTVMLDQDLELTAVYGPHIHRYTSELTTQATCTTDGLLTYTCMCGDTYSEVVNAIGHNYEAITATGDSDPSRCTFVCTNCGDRYEYALNYKVEERSNWGSRTVYEFALTDDNLETGMQPDGSIDVRVPLNEFQSTATHVTVKRYVNGTWETVPAQIEDGFLVITADHFTPYEVQFVFSCNETGNHSWDEGAVTKEASCTEEGSMIYTCETCEGTKTEPINKKDHTLGTWIIDKAATCQETGGKHQECAVCHSTIATETIEKNASNHASYGTTLKNKVDAKCTTKGYTGDTVCDGCGAVLARGSETKDLGHTAPNSKGDCDRCGAHLKDPDSGSSTPANACKYCGEKHTGPFGWLVKFFHSILALFGLRK